MTGKHVAAILRIGLIAGTLDITDALVFSALHGVAPAKVFRFIASGLLGETALQGGLGTAVLGLLLHYDIALSWTAIFYVTSLRWKVLTRRPVVSGLIYGAFVYVLMNFVVLPLSRIPARGAPTLVSRVNGVLAILLCIGLAISFLTRREQSRATSA